MNREPNPVGPPLRAVGIFSLVMVAIVLETRFHFARSLMKGLLNVVLTQ